MKKYTLKIFCSFEGTVTKNNNLCDTLKSFTRDKNKFENIISDLHAGRIETRDALILLAENVDNFSYDELHSLLDKQQIDEHFKDFSEFCKENNYSLYILSEGIDYYPEYILRRESIDAKYFGVKMITGKSGGKFLVEFPFEDEYCRSCGTCKRNILINNTNDLQNEISVFIGDGLADFCVSGFADIVFAKGKLASHCWKNNITYFEYKDFSDVKKKIFKITGEKKLKHRREAMIRRKDIFMGG